MVERLEILPVAGPLRGTVQPPGSKSVTNRALICAALAEGESLLCGALDSEDTRVLVDSLGRLGLSVAFPPESSDIRIAGCGGTLRSAHADLYIANSGTSVRFLTALCTLGTGHYRLDGTARMRERPIRDLLDSLTQLGVSVRSESNTGCPPVVVDARGLPGGTVQMRGDVSSQFLSGLLLAAPYAQSPLSIEIIGKLVSQPYVTMTLGVMRAFGVDVKSSRLARFDIPQGRYAARQYAIEPDASAASYFWAAAAITGGEVTIKNLSRDSLQGDVRFCDVLAAMGCEVGYASDQVTVRGRRLHGVDVDMNAISDTVQTLAAVALYAEGPTTIRGVGHIRHKETDRIGALATELRKLGAEVVEAPDGLTIVPRTRHAAEIDTYHDHRMAMSLALVGLRTPGVVIRDPGCTAKTYPKFFADLAALCAASR